MHAGCAGSATAAAADERHGGASPYASWHAAATCAHAPAAARILPARHAHVRAPARLNASSVGPAAWADASPAALPRCAAAFAVELQTSASLLCVQLLLCLCSLYEAACRCTSTVAAATAAVGRATWHAAPRIRRSPARDAASARVPGAPARVEAPRHATAAAAMTCSYTSFLRSFGGFCESRGQQAAGMANCLGLLLSSQDRILR